MEAKVRIDKFCDITRVHARERGDKAALIYGDTTFTYTDLDRNASRAANALIRDGVKPQEHIAFLDKNTPEYFDVTYGAGKANVITVAVNWRLAAPEMSYVISDAQAKILFVGAEFFGHVEQFENELLGMKIVALGDHPRWQSWSSWLEGVSDEDPQVPVALDDVCMQLYTSGTTGLPKGAMLTNQNLFGLIGVALPDWGFDESSVNLVCMPLFHIAGCGWAVVGHYPGGTNILTREVNPAEILELIPKHKVTNALFVPALLQFLLITPGVNETDFSSLRAIIYGASPITEEVLVASMKTFGCGFVQAYGLTESTGGVVILRAEDHDPGGPRAHLLRSAGLPFPGIEIKCATPDGKPVPTGEVGEIWIKGNQVMKGYWNMPEETEAAITPDGWLKSGDAGYFDEEGYLYIYDRVKDMIVSGGENVYPAEVENALMAHPGIADVAVIGVPDDKWGEAVKAVVVKADAAVTADDIIAFVKDKIAGYKCPKSVDFADALPRNPSGKILKREIREPYWKGVARRVN